MLKRKYVCKFFAVATLILLFWGIQSAVNAEAQPSDFVFDTNTGTITKYIGAATEVYIPDTINGVEVKSICNAFYLDKRITSVSVPSGVTSIDSWAFYNCSNLTSINLPESITSIGHSAFSECSKLKSINLPNGVTRIDDNTFYNCSSITSVNIPESVGAYAFYNCRNLSSVKSSNGIKSIGDYAFKQCIQLTSIKISNNLTSIGKEAFFGCIRLSSINIQDGTKDNGDISDITTCIGDFAFYDCSSLATVSIPNSIKSIGDYAFECCSSLTSISIPDSVTSIGNYVFYGCNKLTSISIPNSVTSIGKGGEFNNFTIFAREGSYAQTYAKVNNIPFQVLENIMINHSIEPDFTYSPSVSAKTKAGFKVEVIGQPISTYTDAYGNFELNVPNTITVCDIKISKPGFLPREITNINVNQESPISMWAGDINGDNAINIADIMEVTKDFNSIEGDGTFIADYDFNKDGVINIQDIMIVAKHFNAAGY